MTENEKRAHDIAVAIMQKNIQPATDGENYHTYVFSALDFYNSVYTTVKNRLNDLTR